MHGRVLGNNTVRVYIKWKGDDMIFFAVRINADPREKKQRYQTFPNRDDYEKVWKNGPQNGFHECVNFENFEGQVQGYLPPRSKDYIRSRLSKTSEPFGIIFLTPKTKTCKDLKDQIIGIQLNCKILENEKKRKGVPNELKKYLSGENALTYHYTAPYKESLLFSQPVGNASECLQPKADRKGKVWCRGAIQQISDKHLRRIFDIIKRNLNEREQNKWEWLMHSLLPNAEKLNKDFDNEVSRLLRQKGNIATKGRKHPTKKEVITTVYERSPSVTAATLRRANGVCECCGQPAPFNRKSDGTPYLEVHHKIPLAENGADILKNTEALCPNCHRRKHLG